MVFFVVEVAVTFDLWIVVVMTAPRVTAGRLGLPVQAPDPLLVPTLKVMTLDVLVDAVRGPAWSRTGSIPLTTGLVVPAAVPHLVVLGLARDRPGCIKNLRGTEPEHPLGLGPMLALLGPVRGIGSGVGGSTQAMGHKLVIGLQALALCRHRLLIVFSRGAVAGAALFSPQAGPQGPESVLKILHLIMSKK